MCVCIERDLKVLKRDNQYEEVYINLLLAKRLKEEIILKYDFIRLSLKFNIIENGFCYYEYRNITFERSLYVYLSFFIVLHLLIMN